MIGYKPAVIMSEIDHTSLSKADTDTVDSLTYVDMYHPTMS